LHGRFPFADSRALEFSHLCQPLVTFSP
jgi:hypothetical protein